jgi:uncharacterized protein YfaS (alpha-2-macroglobulin family)
VAIVDLLPGGMEPVIERPAEPEEERFEGEEDGNGDAGDEEQESDRADRPSPPPSTSPTGWEPFYVDTRDDRVVIYGLLGPEVVTHEYKARAINAGTFRTPPPYAEGMYERGAQGRGEAGTLTIASP